MSAPPLPPDPAGWKRRDVLRLLGAAAVAGGLGGCSGSSDAPSATGSTTSTTHRGSTTTAQRTTTTAAPKPPVDADWSKLASDLTGKLVRPSDASYDSDRVLFNPLFDGTHPQGLAQCAAPEDVAACMAFAEAHEVPFAVRGGGHSFGGYSTGDGLVIDLGPMSQIDVRSDGTAKIGAGARLIDVYAQLAAKGVMIPAGSCPTVGIAGLTLGGGVGVVSRKYGLTIDNLESIDVVLADGRAVTCDESNEPELFWALRGGGAGSFGVVTAFTFRTHPAPGLALGSIRWPWSAAADVSAAWLEWAPNAPDELWSNCLMLAQDTRTAGLEPTVRIGAVHVGTSSELSRLLDDLVRQVGHPPTRRTGRTSGWLDAMRYEGGCSDLSVDQCRLPSQGPAGRLEREASVARAEYLTKAPTGAQIRVMVDAVDARQADSGLAGGGVAFDAYGGAINRVASDATAFVHRDPICGVLLNGTFPTGSPDAVVDANRRWVDDLGTAMRSFTNGQAYQNYIDPRRDDWAQAYYGTNLPRLQRAKKTYDPDDRFHFAQSIRLP